MNTMSTAATTSLVTAAVMVGIRAAHVAVDTETLGYMLLLAHAAAHAMLPLAMALYGRLLALVQPRAAP